MSSDARLSAIIFEASHLFASLIGWNDLIERLGELVFHSTGASAFSISLRHPESGAIAHFARSREAAVNDALFSRVIRRRLPGQAEVTCGQIELRLPHARFCSAGLLALVDILAAQLGMIAEGHALDLEAAKLGEERQAVAWRLRTEKLLARAAGIVAARRRYTNDQAIRWLQREAVRQGAPVWKVAESLIETHQQQKTLAQTA